MSSTLAPASQTATSTSTSASGAPNAAPTGLDATARLIPLPGNPEINSKAVPDLFPLLSQDANGLPVPAVCHLSPADGTAISPCPLPSAQVWDAFTTCVRSNCERNRSNSSSRTSADDRAEIQAEECALRSCREQFIAASANLCLPLSAQVLSAAKVYLPQLPSAAASDPTFVSLHALHLASVGQPSQSPPSNNAAQGSLGICVPAIPIGSPCDPMNDYSLLSAQGSPWFLPAPMNLPLSTPQPGQPIYPKAMIAYAKPSTDSSVSPFSPIFSTDQSFIFAPGTGTDQLRPPVFLRYLPTESGQRIGSPSPDQPSTEKARALASTNVYSLTYCDPRNRTHQPTLAPTSTGCVFDAQCRHSQWCGRRSTCAESPRPSWAPVSYLGNDAQDWLANERRSQTSQFTLQLTLVCVVCMLWCLHACRARVFRAWVSVNRKVKGESNTVMRELALQPASNLMLDELGDGRNRQQRNTERGIVDEELGIVVLEGVDALPQYQPPGAGVTLDREREARAQAEGEVSGPPPPAFTSVAPGASVPATAGEEVIGGPTEASLATADSVQDGLVHQVQVQRTGE